MDATGYNLHTTGQHRITGTFENTTHPTLTNGDDYRLLFTQARKGEDGEAGAAGAAGSDGADGADGVDGTSGGATGSLVAFRANLASIAQTFSNVGWSDLLSIVGVVDINEAAS